MRGWLVPFLLATAATAHAADPWSKTMSKRGVDPALAENPIAITPEIRAAAARPILADLGV